MILFSKIFVLGRTTCGIVKHHIDLDVFDICAIDKGDYYVKFHLCNKDTYYKWALVAIYGPAQAPQKGSF
jgi:hypothetical protein